MGKGVAADSLDAQGIVPAKPLADNGTPKGRSANNRIAFHVVTE